MTRTVSAASSAVSSRGFTDSRSLRARNIESYGASPLGLTELESRRAHGVDERIPVGSLRPAIELYHRLVLELAARNPRLVKE